MIKARYLTALFLLVFFANITAQKTDSLHIFATMTGEKSGDTFYVVKGVGDINGDGYDDVMIGAPGGNYAKLYFGGAVFDTVADMKFVMPKGGYHDSEFGYSISKGDYNGDGFTDIAIGAPHYGDFDMGRVFIYFGGPLSIDTTVYKMLAPYTGFYFHFGESIASGDINGDGIDDLIVGAPFDDISERGHVFVYFGGKTFGDTVGKMYVGEKETGLGKSVAIAGDINKDGCKDFLIGVPYSGLPITTMERAYLIYGDKDNKLDSMAVFYGDSTEHKEGFGKFTAGLGDVDGDGNDDFAVMSMRTLKIYSGKTFQMVKRITAPEEWIWLTSLAGGMDLNKDKYNDILIGAENSAQKFSGLSAVFLGGNELDSIPGYLNKGRFNLQYFGNSIDYAGDVNGDGYKDIIVGSNSYLQSQGSVSLLSLNASIDDVKNKVTEVKDYKLYQNYPNPFNPSTTIAYDLPKSGHVTLKVYNILGSEIATLLDKDQVTGSYTFNFDASKYHLSSGLYLLQLSTGENGNSYSRTIKLSLIK